MKHPQDCQKAYDWAMHQRDVQQQRAEQAERERDDARRLLATALQQHALEVGRNVGLEYTLERVPALVKAIRDIANASMHDRPIESLRDHARTALRAWEEQA